MIIKVNDKLIYNNITEASTFLQRLRGLIGKKSLNEGEGMWFEKCSSIHCFFMSIPIDVVYCDKEYCVVGIETVQSWKVGHFFKGARHILELGEGKAETIHIGDRLILMR